MNFKDVSQTKMIIFFGLVFAAIISLGFLVFGLIFADTESIYRKYALIIGLGFILLSRVAISFYKKNINNQQPSK